MTEGCSVAPMISRSTGAPLIAKIVGFRTATGEHDHGRDHAKLARNCLARARSGYGHPCPRHESKTRCRPSREPPALQRVQLAATARLHYDRDRCARLHLSCRALACRIEADSARLRLFTTSSSVTFARKLFTCRPIDDQRSWVQQRSPLTQPSTASPSQRVHAHSARLRPR